MEVVMSEELKVEVPEYDAKVISEIADRAVQFSLRTCGKQEDKISFVLDLTAVHANGCELNLVALLNYTSHDFMHDVYGIKNHLNRSTGKLLDGFEPFSRIR